MTIEFEPQAFKLEEKESGKKDCSKSLQSEFLTEIIPPQSSPQDDFNPFLCDAGDKNLPAPKPAAKQSSESIDSFIDRLGNRSWRVREEATRQLAEKGPAIIDRLLQGLKTTDDPEVKGRLRSIIRNALKPTFRHWISITADRAQGRLEGQELVQQKKARLEALGKYASNPEMLKQRLAQIKHLQNLLGGDKIPFTEKDLDSASSKLGLEQTELEDIKKVTAREYMSQLSQYKGELTAQQKATYLTRAMELYPEVIKDGIFSIMVEDTGLLEDKAFISKLKKAYACLKHNYAVPERLVRAIGSVRKQ